MNSKSTSSFPGLNAYRRPSKLGDMLAQKKIDEARRLTPEQRLSLRVKMSETVSGIEFTEQGEQGFSG